MNQNENMKDGKYEEALERARQGLPIDKIFPELYESEDERIRNLIYCLIRDRTDNRKLLEHNGVSVDDALAYLERQKEQKPEIKYVYPIFKVGDTIKPKAYNESHRIDKIKDDNYVLDNGITFPIVGQDVWEIVEQKPAEKISVSEELYEHIRNACACIEDAMSSDTLYDMTDYLEMADSSAQKAFDMVERSVVKQPAEWSEEDEQCLDVAIEILENLGYDGEADNLKHLRHQPHWKPSKEQMRALKSARYMMSQSGDYYDTTAIIDSLITDLQKLL